MDFFTADLHLDHDNIIRYCNRPFGNVDEMNTVLLDNINEMVMPRDTVYFLGDVIHKSSSRIDSLLGRINCKNLFLVPGNHDRPKQLEKYFQILPQGHIYTNGKYSIVLSHYAWRVWPHSHHGYGMLYGHSHGNLDIIPGAPTFDVGVDSWNYKPVSLPRVKAEMERLCSLGPKHTPDHYGRCHVPRVDSDPAPQ